MPGSRRFVGLGRCALLLLLAAGNGQAQVRLSEGTNLAVDASPSGDQLVMDLLGSLWILDATGGRARIAADNLQPALRPQWSPDGQRILYQTSSALGSQLWVLDVARSESAKLSSGPWFDQHASWHPDGERVVFSSERRNSGFDLWEQDLATGLCWRLTHHRGDETAPTWSPDGEDLAYIAHRAGQWRLVLRRQGSAEVDLVVSGERLAAPSWRPDGSLLTFLRRNGQQYALEMVILSDPPVIRSLASDQDFFLAPASWIDRQRFLYTADGVIRIRNLNAWKAEEVPFLADVGRPPPPPPALPVANELPVVDAPEQRLVIRAARLFDGMTAGYRADLDVLIDGGKIAAVVPRRAWDDATVLDVGDTTILPGFIDIYSSLPDSDQPAAGLQLLAFGVTTLVAAGPSRDFDPDLWETESTPGPRLLHSRPVSYEPDDDIDARLALVTVPAADVSFTGDRERVEVWQQHGVAVLAESLRIGVRVGADLFLGAETWPVSPLGRQYRDIGTAFAGGPITLVSGLADAGTPGLSQLLKARQAELIGRRIAPERRYSTLPDLAADTSRVVVGSRPDGLPAGLALHAELRALGAAGLSGDQVLWAAGRNAAEALGVEGQIGRIAAGSLADLVLVAGDPRERIADALQIVAVVRNGRFYSLVSLLERAKAVE
ncbi:MAG: amidohydrolase family protein [Woeseiaceae bacterium]